MLNTDSINFFLKGTLVNTKFDVDDEHILAVERIIRNSLEYKKYIADKRANNNENYSQFIDEISFEGLKKSKLELHHVIRLYDLVKMGYFYLLENEFKNISTYNVAEFIIQLHYENIVPYVFLAETYHDLLHEGKVSIKKDSVKGNYKLLLQKYGKYFIDCKEAEDLK